LCRFSRSELTNFIQSSPNIKRLLIEFATRELDMAEDQLLLLGNGSAEEKVAIFLVSWRNFRYFQKLCHVRISLIFSV
jgi:CRP/FNR family transcriptional regulator, anaerobic regulatory protein